MPSKLYQCSLITWLNSTNQGWNMWEPAWPTCNIYCHFISIINSKSGDDRNHSTYGCVLFLLRTNTSTRVGRFSYKERALKIYTDDNRPNNWKQQDTYKWIMVKTALRMKSSINSMNAQNMLQFPPILWNVISWKIRNLPRLHWISRIVHWKSIRR